MEQALPVLDAGPVITIAAIALVVTKVVDAIRNGLGDRFPKVVSNLLAFGVGVLAAYAYEAAGFTIQGGADTTLGTGLIIGAVASGWHEVLERINPKRK